MADDAPPELPPCEGAAPPELPPRESVKALSLEEEDVADLDAAAEDEASDVIDVAMLVEEKENALHAGLEAMYGDMADSTFKALRRVMPITKLKMKWSVDALRLKGGLTKAAAEV